MVFDSSAKFNDVSLNSVLMSGPDLTNSLLGILLRFRSHPVAVTADIEQMFYGFLVREDHRNFLRFLWYSDNNPDKDLVEYRMRAHVFGNSPSPAIVTYGLLKIATASEKQFGSDVKEFIGEEISCIKEGKKLPKNSPLLALNPFLDSFGVLRVGGRLNKATLQSAEKNPIILSALQHISTLLFLHYHSEVKHQGRHFTEGAVRAAGYWIIGGKRLISSLIHKCVKCRRMRGKQMSQQMSDLPKR